MERYEVKLTGYALRELNGIYGYIAHALLEPQTARKLIGRIEEAIDSLSCMPERCAERKVGAYASCGYRQLLVGNYTIIFRIEEEQKRVIIVTVRYSASKF